MKKVAILIFLVLVFACQTSKKNKVDNKNEEIVKLNSIQTDSIPFQKEMAEQCIQKDTIAAMGTSIKYSYENESFRIIWSDSSYERSLDSLFHCDFDERTGTWDFVPKYIHETKNTVVLQNTLFTSSGANPAPLEYYVLILPKNKKDTISEIELFIMTEGNYLVYGNAYMENIRILNLETKKEQTIKLSPKILHIRSPTMAIQKTRMVKNTFYIEYEALKKVRDDYEEIIVKKSFKIKI